MDIIDVCNDCVVGHITLYSGITYDEIIEQLRIYQDRFQGKADGFNEECYIFDIKHNQILLYNGWIE